MRITYYVYDLAFPLVEGVRKQAWMLATAMQNQGHQVTILSTSPKNKRRRTMVREGITIRYGSPWQISRCKTEVLHYISHPSPLILPLLLRAKAKKQIMTMYDGALNGFWRRWWDCLMSSLVKKKVQIITLQTNFQRRILKKTRLRNLPVEHIPPLIPTLKRVKQKDDKPRLLFMSHLSPSKGIREVLLAFYLARKEIKNLRLVICNSKIQRNRYGELIRKINRSDIILKEKVNPAEELSKAWIYLYPLRRAQETFSIPLSLIEAAQVGTPYISTKVGAIPEYFPEEYLVSPGDVIELHRKIIELLKKKKHNLKMKKEINNKEVVAQFLQLYQK